MKDINNISSIYFLGIGGIGMSALARYFNQNNIKVSGYDKTETALTKMLVAEGIPIHYTDDVNLVNKNADIVVYTPAVPAGHAQLNFYKNNNYTLLKRSDVLGLLTQNKYTIAVAGTHGKTTTSAMVAHILTHSQYGCTAFLGGIATNYVSNFLATTTLAKNKNIVVVEADEYDRSFLKLQPDIAIITSMDADHLDIYGTVENMEEAFIDFSKNIKSTGYLIVKSNLKRVQHLHGNTIDTYTTLDNNATIFIKNLEIKNGAYKFDVQHTLWHLQHVVLHMGGLHNLENVVAAIAVAKYLKIDDDKILEAINTFVGVKRRFEYVINPQIKNHHTLVDAPIMIDDYAHHPEELRALLEGAKNLYPTKEIIIIFQPHLFSRTKDLASEFASVLTLAHETILLPIYPARELAMPGITSQIISNKMNNCNVSIKEKDELLQYFAQNKNHNTNLFKNKIIITAGAGDIDTLVNPIKRLLQ